MACILCEKTERLVDLDYEMEHLDECLDCHMAVNNCKNNDDCLKCLDLLVEELKEYRKQ